MKVYFAADHAGFELKNTLLSYVRDELGHEVEDCGAYQFDAADDYPEIIARAARALSKDAQKRVAARAVVLGGSGQGEAIVANRFSGVRCALYYGAPGQDQIDAGGKQLDMIASTREHNNSNALSLGARFLSEDEAVKIVKLWLSTPYGEESRHARRIAQIDDVSRT